MRYVDIKGYVLSRGRYLGLVPGKLVEKLLREMGGYYWAIPGITDVDYLTHVTHPRITCTTHTLLDSIKDQFSNYRVCTISVDDTPAFFFVGVHESCSSGKVFILDIPTTKTFIQLLVGLQLEKLDADGVTDITQTMEIPELTKLYDVEIEYGVPPTRGTFSW